MAEHVIGIVGAGPASLYAAEKLSKAGYSVVMLNRDIKHGGLAEFGIYPNKYKMKIGLRKVFNKILEDPRVHYYGDVQVGQGGDFTIEDLQAMGFAAVVVAVGAQGTKWLGMPGEDSVGVYHAKDLVYHYNSLPPFSEQSFAIGQNVCVIGLGNVALDIVHWLVCERKVSTATLIARRGPGERAYTDKEMKIVAGALDMNALTAEFERIRGDVEGVGQDPEALLDELRSQAASPLETETPTKLMIRYLRSPKAIQADENGQTTGLVCDVMRLESGADSARAVRTPDVEVVPCDTVIFAIGDSIEPAIGLPLSEDGKTFATLNEAWDKFPDRERYRVRNPQTQQPYGNIFVVGWARKASDGLVGKARQDATTGCDEIQAFLNGEFGDTIAKSDIKEIIEKIEHRLSGNGKRIIRYSDIQRLDVVEASYAKEHGLPEYKFPTRAEILAALKEHG